MNIEKYLPIGSVVLLKNATKRIMIVGFVGMESNNVVNVQSKSEVQMTQPQITPSTTTFDTLNFNQQIITSKNTKYLKKCFFCKKM